ncbi:MAG: flagellar hook-length control protein FliK [Butyrivibrio sp.]
MTTGNISSADVSAVLLNAGMTNGIISSGMKPADCFQSFLGQQKNVHTAAPDTNRVKPQENTLKTEIDQNAIGRKENIVKSGKISDNRADERVCEELKQGIKDIIKNRLGITDEELELAMANLGLNFADLLIPQNVSALVAEISGIDTAAILTDSGVSTLLADIIGSVAELVNQTAFEEQITVKDLMADFKSYTDEGTSEELPKENVQTVKVITDSETGKEITITVRDERVSDSETRLTRTGDTVTSNDNIVKEFGENSQNMSNQSEDERQSDTMPGSILNIIKENVTNVLSPESDFSQMYGVNPADIINQMIDSIRLNVTADTTRMELLLTPESLGKINLTVSSKEGVITASITAENENVKAVIESQIVQLKEALNGQGLKVTDVEVAVAGQAFDHNAENNNGRNNPEGQNTRRRFRGIDELGNDEEQTEESVFNKMMKADGNSVDLQA